MDEVQSNSEKRVIKATIDERRKKSSQSFKRWLIVIWQNGAEKAFLDRRTQGGSHGV